MIIQTSGYELVNKWNLPKNLQDAVSHHHHPEKAHIASLEAYIIHVSDVIVHALELGTNGGSFVPNIDEKAWDKIGIPLDNLPYILKDIQGQFEDVVRIMLKD